MLKDALTECGRYEQLLSRTVEGSDVWRINHAGGEPVEVSDDTAEILRCAIRIAGLSGGAFDVTIAPVSTLWDFTSGAAVLPDAETIAKAAELVDYTKIELNGNTVKLPAGMMIDLGGIAKGYIADRVAEYLEKRGVKHAILSFGGNVVAVGLKPDGSPWTVGIQDIDGSTGKSMLKTKVSGGSSVTILSESSMECDALSTTAFILGTEEGIRLIESLKGVEAIFIARDRTVTCTSGAEYEWIK